MRVLLDHGRPAPLRRYFPDHLVTEAIEKGWDRLSNSDLLTEAEAARFDVFFTADKNIRRQQNLKGRKIAIVELGTSRRERRHTGQLVRSRHSFQDWQLDHRKHANTNPRRVASLSLCTLSGVELCTAGPRAGFLVCQLV